MTILFYAVSSRDPRSVVELEILRIALPPVCSQSNAKQRNTRRRCDETDKSHIAQIRRLPLEMSSIRFHRHQFPNELKRREAVHRNQHKCQAAFPR